MSRPSLPAASRPGASPSGPLLSRPSTAFRPGIWLLQALAFVGIPLLLGLAALELLARQATAAARQAEIQLLREILTQTAARGNLPTALTALFERLSSLPWTPARFARQASALLRRQPGVFDLFLFDAQGRRVSIPGVPDTLVFASQKFLEALRREDARVPAKLIQGFAGNPRVPARLRASPGLLVDLLNGDRRTWGGWWTLRDRHGKVTGHLIVFAHRAASPPDQTLEQAVARAASQVASRFHLGWYDPLEPGILRPLGASFPAELVSTLQRLSPARPVTDVDGRPLAVHLTETGAVLFGLARHPPRPVTDWRRGQGLLLVGGLLALVLSWALSPLRSLRTRLILQFLVGGGIPLAVFLGTVLADRDLRERLLVARLQDTNLEILIRLDQDLPTVYTPLLRRYRATMAALNRIPLASATGLLERLADWASRQRGLASHLILTDAHGRARFFRDLRSTVATGRRARPNDVFRLLSHNILRSCNGEPVLSSGSSPESVLAGVVADSQRPWQWLAMRGRLTKTQVAAESLYTCFDLRQGRHGRFNAVLFCVHQARHGQITYLRRLMRDWYCARALASQAPAPRGAGIHPLSAHSLQRRPAPRPRPLARTEDIRLAALPLTPGGDWPAFPRAATGRDHELRQMRDLAVSTGLPQHRVTRVGGRLYLVSASRGTFLDGYVLFVARPYATIQAAARELTGQAALLAGLMLVVSGLVAAGTSRFLLGPITDLQHGLEALRQRDFRHLVPPGHLADLTVVTDRFNQIMARLGELQVARSIQEALWPREGLAGPGWRVAGACRTATHLGGDHHDWFRCPDGSVLLAIGDVAGHGIPSALVGAAAKALLALTAPLGDPAAILAAMNRGFLDQAGRAKPMSFWVGLFDPTTRRLRFANAGHNFPLAVRPTGELVTAGTPGYPLGTRRHPTYTAGLLDLTTGGRLHLYSDGLIEAHDRTDQPYGYDRFADTARDLLPRPVEEAIAAFFARAAAWAERDTPEDDQTLVILDLDPAPPVPSESVPAPRTASP